MGFKYLLLLVILVFHLNHNRTTNVLRILYPIYGKHVYTWVFVRWGRLAKEIQNYEKEYVDFLLLSDGRHVLEAS